MMQEQFEVRQYMAQQRRQYELLSAHEQAEYKRAILTERVREQRRAAGAGSNFFASSMGGGPGMIGGVPGAAGTFGIYGVPGML